MISIHSLDSPAAPSWQVVGLAELQVSRWQRPASLPKRADSDGRSTALPSSPRSLPSPAHHSFNGGNDPLSSYRAPTPHPRTWLAVARRPEAPPLRQLRLAPPLVARLPQMARCSADAACKASRSTERRGHGGIRTFGREAWGYARAGFGAVWRRRGERCASSRSSRSERL